MAKICNKLILLLSILMLAIFVPVVFAVGLAADYMDDVNLVFERLLPNSALFAMALAGGAIGVFLMWTCRKTHMTLKGDVVTDIVLIILFAALFYVNVGVAKEIAFRIGWDVEVARGLAYYVAQKEALGYYPYLSMYHNNIPIIYILGRIYRKVLEMGESPYIAEFAWLQVNCALISIGGYFGCILVKKLTRQLAPTIAVFLLYLALVGISPWKIAPYTDTYAIIFPIMCIYFYFCYRDAKKSIFKYPLLAFSLLSGMVGGYIKASVYLIVIAVLGVEFIQFLMDFRMRWKYILAGILMTIVFGYAEEAYTGCIIEEIGLDYNEEIEGGWQHYFYMGLNDESLGGYESGAVAMFGEFQTSKSDRNKAEIERAIGRMKERGFFGSIYFWLKKMVKTFDDGTFGWCSDVWIAEYFPDGFASNTVRTERLRNIFWNEAFEAQVYKTLAHLIWIFCILGIPGICFCRGEKRERYAILVVSFMGVFFYQMLLEASARYLFVFLPLLVVISVCGMHQYAVFAEDMRQRRRDMRIQPAAEGSMDMV